MKHIFGIILAIVIGIIFGFFGVFNSVFSDGSLQERLVFIAVILLIYVLVSALWGFVFEKHSWAWGLFISLPGALFLLLFVLMEFNPYILLYIVTLIDLSCGAAYAGHALRKRFKAKR